MLAQSQQRRYCPADFDLFIGMDVDKKRIDLTCADARQVIRSVHIPNHSEDLIRYVRKHFPGQKVLFAYEAGPTGYGLYDGLATAGFACVVSPPFDDSHRAGAPGENESTGQQENHGSVAGGPAQEHSCSFADVPSFAASDQGSGSGGPADCGHQVPDQGFALVGRNSFSGGGPEEPPLEPQRDRSTAEAALFGSGPVSLGSIAGGPGVSAAAVLEDHAGDSDFLSPGAGVETWSVLLDEPSGDWTDGGPPSSGPDWLLAESAGAPGGRVGGFVGIGAHGTFHGGPRSSRIDHPWGGRPGAQQTDSERLDGHPPRPGIAGILSFGVPAASSAPGRSQGHCGCGAKTDDPDFCGVEGTEAFYLSIPNSFPSFVARRDWPQGETRRFAERGRWKSSEFRPLDRDPPWASAQVGRI
jgi:hypothetical protein